jgi:manganese transport protein
MRLISRTSLLRKSWVDWNMQVESAFDLTPLSSNRSAKRTLRSLEGLNGTVPLPPLSAGFWRQWRAFVGPAFLISVGYMDPGNWGTDLEAGARFKYGLLWVVGLASFMAIIMQVISARLGIVTGKDLAQACRDYYPNWVRLPLWLFCEIAIAACDLAEVLGSAVALNLLFGIPLTCC